MTVDERLGQLFMIECRPTYGQAHIAEVERMVQQHHVGGIIFFKGDPTKVVIMTNRFQAMSKTKLMIAIDGEWVWQ